jgi:imidazolonepropionase-like amidohydrolase
MAYESNGWSGDAHGPVLFTNVRILDATGEYPYTGEVLIQGNRIKQVSRGSSRVGGSPMQGNATVIDGSGATLMPGMVDAHLHLSWNNAPGNPPPIGCETRSSAVQSPPTSEVVDRRTAAL